MVERFSGSMSALDESESGWLVRYSDYAALKAENERLERERDKWEQRACTGDDVLARTRDKLSAAERALAERAGGVKVKALVELERALCEFINAASDQYDPAAWILETKRNFEALSKAYSDAYSVGVFSDALTAEPAAPEGRQDDGHNDADGYPYEYTRPAEQAVTEAARAVIEWYERDGSVGGAVEPFEALKAAMEAGR